MGIACTKCQKVAVPSALNTPHQLELTTFAEFYEEALSYDYTDSLPAHSEYSYVISYKWWTKWKKFTGFSEDQSSPLIQYSCSRNRPPELTNADILDSPTNYYLRDSDPEIYRTPLKPGLRPEKEIKVLSARCGQLLHGVYGGRTVLRKNLKRYFKPPAPVLYPLATGVLVLPSLDQFELPSVLEAKKLYVLPNQSAKAFIKDLFSNVLPVSDGPKLEKERCRLWVALSTYCNVNNLRDYLSGQGISPKLYRKDKNTSLQEFNCGIEFPGQPLEPSSDPVDRCFQYSNLLVIEVQSSSGAFIFRRIKSAEAGPCPQCKQIKYLVVTCKCGRVTYCSDECQERNKRAHYRNCAQTQSSTGDDIVHDKTMSRSGVVGLSNLGNTCFLNSGMQCLSNIYELTRYFLDKKHVGDINKKNALGTGGALAEAYARFVEEMWNGTGNALDISYVKRVLGNINPIYAGYMQHDSQEVISLILDILHEDLNRVKKKPYIAAKDYLAEDSIVAGPECWDNYLRRNQSVIVDLMHGMFRSSLFCPECKNTFLAYDPFCVVSLPIPSEKKIQEFPLFYVPYGIGHMPFRITLKLEELDSVPDIKKKAAQRLGLGSESFVMGITTYYLNKLVSNKLNASYIKTFISPNNNTYYLMLYQIKQELLRPPTATNHPDLEMTDNNSGMETDNVIVPLMFGFYNEKSKRTEHTTYARILCLNKKMTTAQIYFEVFDYLKAYLKDIDKTISRALSSPSPPPNPETGSFDINSQKLFQRIFPDPVLCEDKPEERFAQYFTLNIVNNVLPLPKGKSPSACPFCGKVDCKNCPLPYSEEVTLETLLAKINNAATCTVANKCLYDPKQASKENLFELEVVWSSRSKDHVVGKINKYDEPKASPDIPSKTRSSGVNIYDCFDQFVKPDVLDDKNKWYCTKCRTHVQATKSMVFYRAPMILVVALKRFKNFSSGMKVTELVDFPVKGLDIGKYIDYNSGSASTAPDSPGSHDSEQAKKHRYDLFAVSNHFGGLGGGHYTAYALNAEYNKWFGFDDSRVSALLGNDPVTSAAYVLFYRRQDLDPINVRFEDIRQEPRSGIV